MDNRIEEFVLYGISFIYFDLSEFETNDEYKAFVEVAKKRVVKYAEQSLFSITNIKNVKFNSETRKIVAEWMAYNKPYIKYGAVIGFDGIKKLMVNAIFRMSGRKNMTFSSDREHATDWLLRQGDLAHIVYKRYDE